jgi:hypothetical protein
MVSALALSESVRRVEKSLVFAFARDNVRLSFDTRAMHPADHRPTLRAPGAACFGSSQPGRRRGSESIRDMFALRHVSG